MMNAWLRLWKCALRVFLQFRCWRRENIQNTYRDNYAQFRFMLSWYTREFFFSFSHPLFLAYFRKSVCQARDIIFCAWPITVLPTISGYRVYYSKHSIVCFTRHINSSLIWIWWLPLSNLFFCSCDRVALFHQCFRKFQLGNMRTFVLYIDY